VIESEISGMAIRNRDVIKPGESSIVLNRHVEELKEKMIGFKNKIERLILGKYFFNPIERRAKFLV
jgi:hypothetical protein